MNAEFSYLVPIPPPDIEPDTNSIMDLCAKDWTTEMSGKRKIIFTLQSHHEYVLLSYVPYWTKRGDEGVGLGGGGDGGGGLGLGGGGDGGGGML